MQRYFDGLLPALGVLHRCNFTGRFANSTIRYNDVNKSSRLGRKMNKNLHHRTSQHRATAVTSPVHEKCQGLRAAHRTNINFAFYNKSATACQGRKASGIPSGKDKGSYLMQICEENCGRSV